jgi:MHS family alpha-ketoglutarate permease-like MFS transporter
LSAGGGLTFYTFTTYMQKYLVNTAGMAVQTANLVMTAALVLFMALQPAVGLLSDRIGRRACLIGFGVLMSVGAVPLMTALGAVKSPYLAFALVACAAASAMEVRRRGGEGNLTDNRRPHRQRGFEW